MKKDKKDARGIKIQIKFPWGGGGKFETKFFSIAHELKQLLCEES
jgi:hypothetical protein